MNNEKIARELLKLAREITAKKDPEPVVRALRGFDTEVTRKGVIVYGDYGGDLMDFLRDVMKRLKNVPHRSVMSIDTSGSLGDPDKLLVIL